MKQQLISVVIPVYNTESFISEAIESVLNQDHKNIELIVVDDGSTDRSSEVIQSFASKLKLISKKHTGIADTRNVGIANCSADIIAFLDADDLWLTNKLSLQLNALSSEADIILGQIENFIDPGLNEADLKISFPKGKQAGLHPGAMLVKKKVFDQIGLFNSELKIGEFVDWFSRVREKKINYLVLEDLVMMRRVHTSNTTRLIENPSMEYLKVIKAKLKSKKAE